jgi:hypothetical protein
MIGISAGGCGSHDRAQEPAGPAADFSGAWSISSKVGDNAVSIQCALVQQDSALTGTCKPAQFAPSPVAGTAMGSSATWGYDVMFNGNQNHVAYEATLGADGTLSGTLHLGPMPTPFTAVRE